MSNVRELFIFGFFLFHCFNVQAGSSAIWPFNTPGAEARSICKSMKGNAALWAENRRIGGITYGDVMNELSYQESYTLRDDPAYAAWTRIYYREMRAAAAIVWRNPDMGGSEAARVVTDYCESKSRQLIKDLETTNPK